MLVKNQIIQKKWAKQNKNYYINKGYIFTNYGDYFNVKAEDLSKGAKDKVKVKCDYCGKTINVKWEDYIKHNDTGTYACDKCRQTKTSLKSLSARQEKIYNKILKICEEKDYVLLTKKEELTTVYSEVSYICPFHGVQYTKASSFLYGEHGCPQCAIEHNSEKHRHSSDYVEKTIESFGGILLNKEDYKTCTTKNLCVVCSSCGSVFITSLYAYTKHNGQRCPTCSQSESHGEYIIRNFLDMYRIENIPQYRFDDCKYKSTLPFDFYIPSMNTIIEYDGEFHYFPIEIDGSPEQAKKRFEETKLRDEIKNNYCKQNGINLIRIPYFELDNINMILYDNLIL